MLNIIKCTICRKPFMSVDGKICQDCHAGMVDWFIIVRDYLDENPSADIDTVSKETEISNRVIMHLLKEGRLVMTAKGKDGKSLLHCEMCKIPITSGRLCDRCKEALASRIDKNIVGGKPNVTLKSEQNVKGSAKIGS
jgi:hypothetical protein